VDVKVAQKKNVGQLCREMEITEQTTTVMIMIWGVSVKYKKFLIAKEKVG
jgi:hypothetical protein